MPLHQVSVMGKWSEGGGDKRVPAGGLDQDVTGFDPPLPLSLLDHALCDPVLDTPASIEELAFGVHRRFDAQALRDFVEAHKRGVADVLDNVVENGRGGHCS